MRITLRATIPGSFPTPDWVALENRLSAALRQELRDHALANAEFFFNFAVDAVNTSNVVLWLVVHDVVGGVRLLRRVLRQHGIREDARIWVEDGAETVVRAYPLVPDRSDREWADAHDVTRRATRPVAPVVRTAAVWDQATDPAPMLRAVAGRVDPTILRRFMLDCCERALDVPVLHPDRAAFAPILAAARDYLEGRLPRRELKAARQRWQPAVAELIGRPNDPMPPYLMFHACTIATRLDRLDAGMAVRVAENTAGLFLWAPLGADDTERRTQADWLRRHVADPFAGPDRTP